MRLTRFFSSIIAALAFIPSLACALSSGPDPSYNDLIELVVSKGHPGQDNAISRIDDLLEIIGQKYPRYLQYHALAYHSLSIQGSSPSKPRAIVVGQKGRLVISFNGSPNEKAWANLEIMSFDEMRGFEFRELTFLGDSHAEVHVEKNEIELQNAQYVISKPNPQVCTQCHGQSFPKPIWQQFPMWPGMYGSNSDHITSPTEIAGYQSYLKGQASDARYRNLGSAIGSSDFAGLYPGSGFQAHVNQSITLRFSNQLAELLVRDLKHRPQFNRNIEILVGMTCSNLMSRNTLPKVLLAQLEATHDSRHVFQQGQIQLKKDDFIRMIDYGALPPIDLEEIIRRAMAPLASFEMPARIEAALAPSGLHLKDYSFNQFRYPQFDNGVNDFREIRYVALREYSRLKGRSHLQSCQEIMPDLTKLSTSIPN